MTNNLSRWERFERSSDAYLAVLVILLLLIVVPILTSDNQGLERALTPVLIGGAVTLSMAASRAHRWAIHASWIASVAVLISLILSEQLERIAGLSLLVLSILMISTPVVILRRVGRHQQVTATTIWGAISAYLAFGVAFSLLYSTILNFDPGALSNVSGGSLGETNYFSFVTMTTLGYGDIAPISDLARGLVVFETLIGQIYLVVVVARVVSLLGKPYEGLRNIEGD